jgi:nucleotide-binding universal stress UspA family protein
MRFKDIVVQVAPRHDGGVDHGARYAIGLAGAHDCRVTALVYEIVVEARAVDPDDADPIETVMDDIRDEAKRTANSVAALAADASVTCETITERSYAYGIGEIFADYGRVRDLAVLGIGEPMGREQRLLAESVLLDSGRPLILVPERVSAFAQNRVMVAWDATPAAVRAIAGAMPFLLAAREVVIVSVLEDKEFRRGTSGAEMCRHLARHGVAATFRTLERRGGSVADVLLEAARDDGADLLVMGGYAHSTLRGLIFGSATRGILETPLALPVLMAH